MPAAIRAISRGETKKLRVISTQGKTYFDRFIRPDESVRMHQKKETDPLKRGFVAFDVRDLDPRKVF
jgi:hypothetical protein